MDVAEFSTAEVKALVTSNPAIKENMDLDNFHAKGIYDDGYEESVTDAVIDNSLAYISNREHLFI